MAASSSVSLLAGSSASIVYPGWSEGEVTDSKVRELLVSKFKEIAASYERRKAPQLVKHLKAGGPWYPMEYALVLKRLNQKARLDFFVKANAFYFGYPPEGFDHLQSKGVIDEKEPCAYRIKPECLPVQGLDNVLQGRVSLIECSNSIQLAMYATLREILGDNKFNQVFSGKGKSPLSFHRDITETSLGSLNLVQQVMTDRAPKLGDSVYFSNVADYPLRHPNGDHCGYHAVCMSADQGQESRYAAFGLPSEGVTEMQVHDILIESFNKEAVDLSSLLSEDLVRDLFFQKKSKELKRVLEEGPEALTYKLDRARFEKVIANGKLKNVNGVTFDAGLAPLYTYFHTDGIKALLN